MTRPWIDGVLRGTTLMPVGKFSLRPVVKGDLDVIVGWMNDPAVDRFWGLAGSPERTAAHLEAQEQSAQAFSLIGTLDGLPMSYWELYRADLDQLSAHYPSLPYDMGIHLLLGPPTTRGRGLGSVLLSEVADRIFAADGATKRIVAEPDVRNGASIRAFTKAGFDRRADLDLPEKTAALMVRERPISQDSTTCPPGRITAAPAHHAKDGA